MVVHISPIAESRWTSPALGLGPALRNRRARCDVTDPAQRLYP